MQQRLRIAVGGGNSANSSEAKLLRVLNFELFKKFRYTERYYVRSPLAQPLSLLPILGKSFQSVTEQTEQLASTSILPQKGGSGINSQFSEGNINLTPKNLIKNGPKAAFTLAEVLITLGIIGVVAAITIPVLLSNVQDRVKEKRVENIKQKLSKVTDAMSATSGLNGYADTMSFVQEMNKHMKIAKICDNSNLSECWPTKEVILDDEGKTWDISKTKNAKTLKIDKDIADNWSDTVGIVTADGTAMILSYDKTCNFNPDVTGYTYGNGLSNSVVCLSGVFDWNGGKNPNKLGKDVITLGVAKGLGNSCAFELDGKCFTTVSSGRYISRSECEEQKKALGIKACNYDIDFWAAAVEACGGVSKMPSRYDLAELASQVQLDSDVASALGITSSTFSFWTNEESNEMFAHCYSTDLGGDNYLLRNSPCGGSKVLCLSD